MFSIATLNVLWGMLAGIRYTRNNTEVQVHLENLKHILRSGSPTGTIMSVFPILRRIIPRILGYTDFMQSFYKIQSFFRVSEKL